MITIRPDRISRTGVVQPTGAGYSPSANAYAVAARFAVSDQLQGAGVKGAWARFKTWMKTSYADKLAMAAAGAGGAPNAIVTDTGVPGNPGASLPPSTASPSYPGQSPDATQMSAMGLYISSGYHPSFVPNVVQGKQQAAAALNPEITSRPSVLAARAMNYAEGRVGQAAWQRAVSRFYAMNKPRIG